MEHSDLDLDLRYRRPQPTRRAPKLPGNLRQLGAVGRHVPAPLPGAPHTVVHGVVQTPHNTARYLNYMQSGKGPEQTNAQLFTAHGRPVEPERFALQSGYDKHQFSFVVSVRDSYAAVLPDYIRDLMTLVERDTQRPLDWMAAVHQDTEQVHTHLLVRGRDRDGKDLYLTTPYLSEGIRYRAQALALRYFGVAKEQGQQHTLHRGMARQPVQDTGRER